MKKLSVILVVVLALIFVKWVSGRLVIPQTFFTQGFTLQLESAKPFEVHSESRLDPLSGGSMAASRLNEKELQTVSIEEFKRSFLSRNDQELEKIITSIDQEIAARGLVERANASKLSDEQAQWLAENVNRKAAAQILIIERSLASLEKRGS